MWLIHPPSKKNWSGHEKTYLAKLYLCSRLAKTGRFFLSHSSGRICPGSPRFWWHRIDLFYTYFHQGGKVCVFLAVLPVKNTGRSGCPPRLPPVKANLYLCLSSQSRCARYFLMITNDVTYIGILWSNISKAKVWDIFGFIPKVKVISQFRLVHLLGAEFLPHVYHGYLESQDELPLRQGPLIFNLGYNSERSVIGHLT